MLEVSKRSIGINFDENWAEICVWAPLAESISLVVPEKSLTLPLQKQEYGYWQLSTEEILPGDRYLFEIDGKDQWPDPASVSQPEGVHGPSEALDITSFNWDDSSWKNHALEEYIIYELHTGTFTEDGTFKAIERKLSHLKNLGVNAIEIMPVAQFPGNRNWGYDGVYPFAVQNTYGSVNGLKQLVAACHEEGIAVILDVVYNHLGPEGNYFNLYGPYFTEKYHTPWGGAINFDDEYCDGVRQYFIENALMWFRDFHIDALRMDAVHAIKDFSPNHILREIKQHLNLLMEQTGRRHCLIAELDLNDNRYINPLSEQGFGLDAQWIDEFHHALRVTATGEKPGYYSDFSGIEDLAKAYQDAYVFDGQYSEHRKKFFGVKADKNPGKQFVVFSQNHDQVGNRMLGERTGQLTSFEMQKLLAGAVLASPYLPMLFMGEEWSEPNPFLYFVSHTDEELVKAVRKGRKEEFASFHAEGEAPDPQSTETFEQSKLQWQLIDHAPHSTMLTYYQELIAVRKRTPSLNNLNRNNVEVQLNEGSKTLSLHRWHDNQHVYCLMNFSGQVQQSISPVHASGWQKLLASSDERWGGTAPMPEQVAADQVLTLPPESFTMYISNHV
ncbi:MAG: malto-oligosyltrehalose trehalohydrolase [Sphingobacteriaceae bacterium]|jgi:maltooligosyltrehalose trehalohydrolase|nr:malto-oligosyltrehalose trehalohydrolase [Sphingobacteriaceae bacterium]